jgi:hypothetical protein
MFENTLMSLYQIKRDLEEKIGEGGQSFEDYCAERSSDAERQAVENFVDMIQELGGIFEDLA